MSLSASKKEFYQRLGLLAFPIMLQNLLVNSASFIDTMMIGMVGQEALAAAGLANQMFFLIALFFFGVCSGLTIFVSQYWGSQDIDSMHKVIGIALAIAVGGAFISSAVSLFFPQSLMRIFTDDPVVIQRGKEYLVVVAVSYLFTAVVMVFSTALRSTTDAKSPLLISIVSMSVNIVFNYLLILGKFGFPRLEVKGAALATALARLVEMILLLLRMYGKKSPVAAPWKSLISFPKGLAKMYFITSFPVILNEMFWSFGITAYKIAYSRLGTEVIATINVSEAISSLFFVALMGISNATAIMVGNKIGEDNLDEASVYARRLTFIAFGSGIGLGALLALFSSYLPLPFGLGAQAHLFTSRTLISLGILMPIKSVNMVIIVGVLRSGGDTRYSMFTELFGVWLIGVPCAFAGAMLFHMPIHLLYLFVGLEEVFKFIVGVNRLKSGKWIRRIGSLQTT
ncbi:MAG: MATE family efflux transporter [Sphaerochaetaceae bacterium]